MVALTTVEGRVTGRALPSEAMLLHSKRAIQIAKQAAAVDMVARSANLELMCILTGVEHLAIE